jgi:hypothetical protein
MAKTRHHKKNLRKRGTRRSASKPHNGTNACQTDRIFNDALKVRDTMYCKKLKNGKYDVKFKDYHKTKRYIGDLDVNGKMTGKGVAYFSNGDIYEGDLVDGLGNGFGKAIFANRDIYIGQTKNGLMHGKGKYIWHDTGNIYEGDWKEGRQEGYGKYVFGAKSIGNKGDTYEGEFLEGKFHGKGVYKIKSAGVTRKGTFSYGEFNGKMESHNRFGDNFVTDWKEGLKDGDSMEKTKNGLAFRQKFENDFPVDV